MNRQHAQIDAFLTDAPDIGGYAIHPLSPGRLAILERRGNKLAGGDNENQTDIDAATEIFYVLTRAAQELTAMRRADRDEWLDAVEEFSLALPATALQEFATLLETELETLEATAVEPGKPATATAEQ
jgi:hypothetical protein